MNDSKDPRDGRGVLLSMGIAYAMGTFNDNFFKYAAILLAADAGLTHIQGRATVLFALPIVLFSVWAGWLADRFPKKDLAVGAKGLEVLAMAACIWSMVALHWDGMVLVVFIMGLQTTFFSPALNGAIPENFPSDRVPRVNAIMKLATTLTILLGIAMAGVALDVPGPDFLAGITPGGDSGFGRLLVGVFSLLVALVGFGAAFGIRKTPAAAAGEKSPFPLWGPVDSARHALECRRKDPALYVTLAGEAFFYGFSSFAILCINNMGIQQIGFSKTVASLLSVALMLGICAGAMKAGRKDAESWRRSMIPAGAAMCLGLGLSGLAPLLPHWPALVCLFVVYALSGLAGGLFLIPLVSFIQIRPAAQEKGKILGISNFASFSAIILSGLVLEWAGAISPARLLVLSGLAGLLFMAWAARRIGRLPGATLADKGWSPLGLLLRGILGLRYRVTASGLDKIPAQGPVLFLPNHPALIDPVILYSRLAGLKPRPLADERQLRGFLGGLASRIIRAVLIPDLRKDGAAGREGVQAGLKAVADALRAGDSVLFYPAGRVYRSDKESLGGNSGTALLLKDLPGVRVVLVRSTGLWGSAFSYAGTNGKAPDFARTLLRGLGAILANLVFFTPRRTVNLEFVEAPADLPRDGDKRVLNPWLDEFYRPAEGRAQAVPRFFWQGAKPVELPEMRERGIMNGADGAPDSLRAEVYAALRQAAELPPDHPIADSMTLNGDLGLDSLALMEFALGLEEKSGRPISDMDAIVTVGDCLAAAAGLLAEKATEGPAPQAWFAQRPSTPLAVPAGTRNIPHAFAALARREPKEVLLADRGGLKNRRDILTGALVLAAEFKKLPGKRLGIMLPAAPAVPAVWLAVLLAEKEPVFFNWTVGEANLRHCLSLTGVSNIISAGALLERLERQGLSLDGLPVEWVRLEKLAAGLSLWQKIRGALAARFGLGARGKKIPAVAAVLFTSGSESLPKAVPLTHANLLANAVDIIAALRLTSGESILAMLPPFHSFGLMAGLVLPLSTGIRAVFHPNPTEAGPLVNLTRDFKLTLLAAPPTFLEAMLDRAKGTSHLDSLRFAFAGAEKCPDHVYRAFARLCPQAALCEGYGITECSPVVSVNRPGNVLPGTIGHALDSLTLALVREEDGQITGRVATGETGMLLARGPSIFNGYLGDAPNPFVEFEGQTWYRTGDLLSMDETGRLTFRGRLKRFVKIGGEMISLPQIENALLELYGSHPDAPAEGPALAVEASSGDSAPEIALFTPLPLNLTEVNAGLRKAGLSPLYAVRRIVKVQAIPLLGSGKTDYRELKKLL